MSDYEQRAELFQGELIEVLNQLQDKYQLVLVSLDNEKMELVTPHEWQQMHNKKELDTMIDDVYSGLGK